MTKPPLIGRALLDVTQRLRGSRSLTIFREIKSAPYATEAEARASQLRQLRALLAHAEARVPYYRELFMSLGFRSDDVRSLDDLSELPVLTKDIIRERQRDLIRDDVPLERLAQHHSGGSTGVPLTFYREQSYMDASEAGTFRNLAQAGWRPGDMVAFFWGWNDSLTNMPRWKFELRQTVRRMYQFDPFRSGTAEMGRWVERWKTLDARVALGYASTIARFAEFVEESGARVASLQGVFTTAEKLYPQQREVISRVFGCKVYDCYGSSEVQNVAAECPRGAMHVNADYVVLEVDGAGAPAPFLVTSLQNYAMPFIRYRNEDCGELIAGHCECGNNFPLMKLNIARVSDNFVFPDGRVVHGEFFTHLMYGSEGIATFQFHQTAPDVIDIWIVPGPGQQAARERALESAIEQIKDLTPATVKINVRETDVIPLSSAGKHRFTRSDVVSVGGQGNQGGRQSREHE